MDGFLSWFFAGLLAAGSALVILGRRPVSAVWGWALAQSAVAAFLFLFHEAALARAQIVFALLVASRLALFIKETPVFPGESGSGLRPFGILCGLAVAFFFGDLLARAAHGLPGAGHSEAVFLFSAGLVGLVARRNLFIALLSLQLLFAGAALFAVFGASAGVGLARAIVLLGIAQGFVGVELLRIFLRERGTLRIEELTTLKF